MRVLLFLLVVVLTACAHRSDDPPGDHIGGLTFVRWGMTIDEVRHAHSDIESATLDEMAVFKTEDVRVLLRMPWQSGRFKFACYFGFDQNAKLAVVAMRLGAPMAAATSSELIGSLIAKYGPMIRLVENPEHVSAMWLTNETVIILRQQIDTIMLSYFPRYDANNSGL